MFYKNFEKIIYGFSFGIGFGFSFVLLPRPNSFANSQYKNLDNQISYPTSDAEYEIEFNSK